MRYTNKDLEPFIGKCITVTGRFVTAGKAYGNYCETGILVEYGYRKYGLVQQNPCSINSKKIFEIIARGIKHIESEIQDADCD